MKQETVKALETVINNQEQQEVQKPLKGLMVNIYKTERLGDSTNGGVTANAHTALLVGQGVPEIFQAREGIPVLKLVRRHLSGGEYLHAEPIEPTKRGCVGWMAGGNFIDSSDDRFPNKYPISVHDRQETQQHYDSMSN